jgi:NAD(P)-dependent dehydrogenase (short-subunit alcohol dehydrogenase family)
MSAKTALITGATDGIGKAVARKLLGEGWRVVIVGRNPQRCEATVAELKNLGVISAITANLMLMSDTTQAIEKFLAQFSLLDFLFLNANAIAQERIVTLEGFESNFALGHLSRALMALKLEPVLKATPNSQIMTIVGLNTEKLDYEDLTITRNYTSGKALARWQWSTQVFTKKFNLVSPVPMNVYMPGLVRTKILANEPQPMQMMVKIMNLAIGIPVEKSAENVYIALNDVVQNKRKDVVYQWKDVKPSSKLDISTDDPQRLWDLTNKLLTPYL